MPFRYVLGLSIEKSHTLCLETVLETVSPDRIHLIEADHPRAQVWIIILTSQLMTFFYYHPPSYHANTSFTVFTLSRLRIWKLGLSSY